MKLLASLVAQMVKNPTAMWETWVRSLGWEDLLQKGMATRSSILAWRIPWTEETGGLQFMGSQRVGHDSVQPSPLSNMKSSSQSFLIFFCQSLPSLSSGCYLHFTGFVVCWFPRVRSKMVTYLACLSSLLAVSTTVLWGPVAPEW